jgi:lipid II isoglutaminyl synthase (glutamine-hydrolysing)
MRKLRIGYLYGSLMNLYGDRGNILALQRRAEWRGIEVSVKEISLADRIAKKEYDVYFFGGGQDQSQDVVGEDLQRGNGETLKYEAERGVPILSICGGYQLLGKYYQPKTGPRVEGIGLFDAYTESGDKRMVGNLSLVIDANLQKGGVWEPHTLVGFENHSGKTYLGPNVRPLGAVLVGHGNNGEDHTEGAVYKNAIGCYLHGSLLPKNPHLSDWLLKKALDASEQDPELSRMDDHFELTAHSRALERAKETS